MMSWAGGWFVLTASEQFPVEELAAAGPRLVPAGRRRCRGSVGHMFGLATLIGVIVLLDQLLWRPLVVWSDRFKFEQSGAADAPNSRVVEWIQGSALIEWLSLHVWGPVWLWMDRTFGHAAATTRRFALPDTYRRGGRTAARWGLIGAFGVLVLWGVAATIQELAGLPAGQWGHVWLSAGATLTRTVIALVIAAAWTIPVGVAIGFNPKWSYRAQPLVQVVASVPANTVFPILFVVLLAIPGGLNIASVLLMLLGTQWYVLFNVIAGAMAIPSDLREAAVVYQVTGWRRWRTLILPAIFPYLVTGMITATGGAWNASIVSEYVSYKGHKVMTVGLGALIADSADRGDFPLLLAGTMVMAAIVITGNRLVWRRLYTWLKRDSDWTEPCSSPASLADHRGDVNRGYPHDPARALAVRRGSARRRGCQEVLWRRPDPGARDMVSRAPRWRVCRAARAVRLGQVDAVADPRWTHATVRRPSARPW